MSYFSNFDRVRYDFTINTDAEDVFEVIPDLTTRVSLWISESDLAQLSGRYKIRDLETPEIVAYNVYGDINLHWVIMYINSITDNSSWPVSEEILRLLINSKYGVTNTHSVHHYETQWGVTGDQSFLLETYGVDNVVTITNYDYESQLNENKRDIIFIRPEYLPAFIAKFQEQLIK